MARISGSTSVLLITGIIRYNADSLVTPPENSFTTQNNSSPVRLLEWVTRSYFNGPARIRLDPDSTPGFARVRVLGQPGFRYQLRTSTTLPIPASSPMSRLGSGSWLDFGTWPLSDVRRFWQASRAEEATAGL